MVQAEQSPAERK